MVQKYTEFINELVKNPSNMTYLSKQIVNKLSKVVDVTEVYDGKYDYAYYYKIEFKYPSNFRKKNDRDIIDRKISKILDTEQINLSKHGIALSYQIERGKSYTPMSDIVRIYLKDLFTQRISPSRFVYHRTDIDRKIIEKEGLKTKPHKTGNFKEQIDLYYPPAIFATNDSETWWKGKHIYMIDTTKIDNKWWYDINLYRSIGGFPISKDDQTNAIMTFEDIPPEAIEFYL